MGAHKDGDISFLGYWKRFGISVPQEGGKDPAQLQNAAAGADNADEVHSTPPQGLAVEHVSAVPRSVSTPVLPGELLTKCLVITPTDFSAEYHLTSETGDPLLTARFFRREQRIEFLRGASAAPSEAAQSPSASSSPRRTRPAFTMNYIESMDEWCLLQGKCEHCVHRPRHLTCEYQGKGQQVARIQHSREKVHEAFVHCATVHLPGPAAIWCPVRTGRDLGRSPKRATSRPQAQSDGAASSSSPNIERSQLVQQEHDTEESILLPSKRPKWDSEVESLVLNFKDRKVKTSPQNFMLCEGPDQESEIVFQHGKLGSNTYFLDFKHPLSPVQAFAISLTSLLWD
eukprot:gnl/TRDRNA2_/TRDRNA2_154491_c0_seq3.p1 gnl/TRDRNA2_/TRDRNA2_154491_c0~~gnl/TRDRNA2_/TRDRNA2_154491_c0_seq3.p1  ORF type:complete len:343 (+),score=61.61 gnl/TRDRNA2_/TRDRNA2_154491_c0_seq3:185-1213(+)